MHVIWSEKRCALLQCHHRRLVCRRHPHQGGDGAAAGGGADGISDRGATDAAPARPRNRAAYGEPDAADLAAACILGLAAGHPFVDGNKLTARVAGRLFVADNGYRLDFDPLDAIAPMERVAAGRVDATALAGWIRARLRGWEERPPEAFSQALPASG